MKACWRRVRPSACAAQKKLLRPKVERSKVKSLSAAQAKALLAKAAEGPAWTHAAVALGLCGLRRGEVLGLAWSDVDLAAGRVHVRPTLTETEGDRNAKIKSVRSLKKPKTKESKRRVTLTPDALAAMRRQATLGA